MTQSSNPPPATYTPKRSSRRRNAISLEASIALSAFRAVGGTPRFIARAAGSKLYDVDGREYIDYVASWGPMILGHAHPQVVRALHQAAERGTSYGAPTEGEVILAGMICEAFPSIDLVRLVSSGTEAAMSAIRVARGYTKRDLIVKFDGCYHGHSDGLLVQAGSGATTLGIPARRWGAFQLYAADLEPAV